MRHSNFISDLLFITSSSIHSHANDSTHNYSLQFKKGFSQSQTDYQTDYDTQMALEQQTFKIYFQLRQ